MPYEVRDGGGTFKILRRDTGDVVLVDGEPLDGLSAAAAGEYLYALTLIDAARGGPDHSRVRRAVERTFRSHAEKPVRSLDDAVVAVKWMIPDLQIADDVLRFLIGKFAAEMDVLLLD